MPHGKPLSNPRAVSVGAFWGLPVAGSSREGLERGPVEEQAHNAVVGPVTRNGTDTP